MRCRFLLMFAGAVALLAAGPSSATFLRVVDVDGSEHHGPSYISAIAPEWSGTIFGGAGSSGAGACSLMGGGYPSWMVYLAVDNFPLGQGANRDHLHARPMSYDVPIVGHPRVTWAFTFEDGPSAVPTKLFGEVVALKFDVLGASGASEEIVVARGVQEVPPGAGGRYTWDLEIIEAVIPRDTVLALRVDLRWNLVDCEVAGLAGARVAARAFSDPQTQSGLDIETPVPLVIEALSGNGTLIQVQAQAAWGNGQFEAPGAALVTVDGAPAKGHWYLDLPVHEDFHAFLNGNRTWVFDPPVSAGAVEIRMQVADGESVTFLWPTQDLDLHVHCAVTGETEDCLVEEAQARASPGLGGVTFLLLVGIAAIVRRGTTLGKR